MVELAAEPASGACVVALAVASVASALVAVAVEGAALASAAFAKAGVEPDALAGEAGAEGVWAESLLVAIAPAAAVNSSGVRAEFGAASGSSACSPGASTCEPSPPTLAAEDLAAGDFEVWLTVAVALVAVAAVLPEVAVALL